MGQTVWPTTRMSTHKNGRSKCTVLVAAGRKHGWENMQWEVLRGGPNAVGGAVLEADLDALEEALIAEHGTLAPGGYNIQKGGKVAWRGVQGLARNKPRGPRSEETKQALRDTWARKREERLKGMDEEQARRQRRYAAKQSESRRAKQDGTFVDGRFQPSQHRRDTLAAMREAKLALLPPEEAARKRARWQARRESQAARACERKKAMAQLTPGNLRATANATGSTR